MRDGKIVSILTSGNYGHAPRRGDRHWATCPARARDAGKASCLPPTRSKWPVSGTRAQASLAPMYDPKSERGAPNERWRPKEKRPSRRGRRAGRPVLATRMAPRLSRRPAPGARGAFSGGQYTPLTEAGVLRIHEAALDALEQVGLSQAPPTGVAAMVAAGAKSRRRRPPASLSPSAGQRIHAGTKGRTRASNAIMGAIPRHHLDLSGTRVHYGTAGGPR